METDRLAGVTTYTYDGNSNLLTMTDPQNQVTKWSYHWQNWVSGITWPDHVNGSAIGTPGYGIVPYSYYTYGGLYLIRNQMNETIAFARNKVGMVGTRQYRTAANSGSPLGPVTDQDTFGCDPANRLLTATKGRYGNTVTFTYDQAGRTATERLTIEGQNYTITSAYDAASRLTQITYPDGTVQGRSYNPRGLLSGVTYGPTAGTATNVATFAYNDGGRETTRTFGNGVVSTRSYGTDGNLAGIATPGVEDFSYTYDLNKNPTAETRTGALSNYAWSTGGTGFDNLDRLTNWTRTNGNSQAWTLMASNNWSTFTKNGTPETRTHGLAHELTAVGATAVTYDNRGNLTQDNRGVQYSYDFDSVLNQAVVPASVPGTVAGTHTYQYDALGRRVAKTVGANTTVYVSRSYGSRPNRMGRELAEYPLGTPAASSSAKYAYGAYVDDALMLVDRTVAGTVAARTDERLYVNALSFNLPCVYPSCSLLLRQKQSIAKLIAMTLRLSKAKSNNVFTTRFLSCRKRPILIGCESNLNGSATQTRRVCNSELLIALPLKLIEAILHPFFTRKKFDVLSDGSYRNSIPIDVLRRKGCIGVTKRTPVLNHQSNQSVLLS